MLRLRLCALRAGGLASRLALQRAPRGRRASVPFAPRCAAVAPGPPGQGEENASWEEGEEGGAWRGRALREADVKPGHVRTSQDSRWPAPHSRS